ncbi:hypothetical protein Tco_0103275 [Tanacetum coccineum]
MFFLKNGNTEEKKYILSLYKIHVVPFPEADLEERMNPRDPYTIVYTLDTCLIYLNNKVKKQVMRLVEIVKFYDAMLEKVLKEVKLRISEIEFWKKPPLLGALDLDLMKAYER